MRYLLDLVFPEQSLRREEGDVITVDEREELQHSAPLLLNRKQLHDVGMSHVDLLIAGSDYHDPLIHKAIRTWKYGRIPKLQHDMAALMVNAIDELYSANSTPSPTLCPVPLHWTRRFHRGFNQSAQLADAVSSITHWPRADLLKRTRPTGHQAWRKREERLTALIDAFRYIGPTLAPQHVILIDDLSTTGSTLNECARTLKHAGVKRVEAFVVAQG